MRRTLALVALLASTPAYADWYEASSKHFVVYSDDRPERIKAYAEKLERYDQAMKVMRGVPEDRRGPAARVTVFQVADAAALSRLYGKGGSNVGGFYQARASGPVAFVPRASGGNGAPWELNAERVLLHEYAHHFMYADWPSAIFPLWYSEGFAEYHSTAIFNADGSVTFGAPPTDRGWGVGRINTMPLSKMLDPWMGKLDGEQTYALYSRGWALTHYLTQDVERRRQLAAYVGAVNDGKPYAETVAPFGDVDALDRKLLSYVQRPTFGSQVVPADRLRPAVVTIRKLEPGEVATMPTRVRSTRGVSSTTEAKRLLPDARASAAAFPNDAAAQNVLAEAEYDAGNFAEAGAAADRALAADPKSIHALSYKGMALQALTEKDKSTDPQRWREVRRRYTAANRIDTEDPQPLILYYRSFKAAGQPASNAAAEGMLYAAALAPFDVSLKLDVARIYLERGKAAEAKRTLEPFIFNPHGGEGAARIRSVVDTLDKEGPQGALARLDAITDEAAAKEKKNG